MDAPKYIVIDSSQRVTVNEEEMRPVIVADDKDELREKLNDLCDARGWDPEDDDDLDTMEETLMIYTVDERVELSEVLDEGFNDDDDDEDD